MTRLSKPQEALIRELQKNPGASFLFRGAWELQKQNGHYTVFTAKPAWCTFKVLMRYGLIQQQIIHEKFVRYSLTKGGERFVV